MNYQKSSSLGMEAKEIISSIGSLGVDNTKKLRRKNSKFYKNEILNYIKNGYDAKDDGKEKFRKVVRVLSFEVEKTPENQRLFLQILVKNPEFATDIIPILDAKFLTDPRNIRELNEIAIEKLISIKDYAYFVSDIIDENINSDKLHDIISRELSNFGKDCPINKEMTSLYLSHPHISEKNENDILEFWAKDSSKNKNALSVEEQERQYVGYVQKEYLSRKSLKKDSMNPHVKVFLISSLTDGNEAKVSKKVAEETMDELIYLYEQRPELGNVVHRAISNIKKHNKLGTFLNDVLHRTRDLPEIRDELLKEVIKRPKDFTADSVSCLPFMSQLNPDSANDYVTLTATAIRNSNYSNQISPIFYDGDIIVNENGDNKSKDVYDDKYKYLTFVAFNDSKLSSSEALYLTDTVIDVISDPLAKEDDDDDDNDNFVDSDDMEKYRHFADYLKIMDESRILRKDNQSHSMFLAGIKRAELMDYYPETINGEIDRIFEKNLNSLNAKVFVEELFMLSASYKEASANFSDNNDVPRQSVGEKIFDFMEGFAKKIKFKDEEDLNDTKSILVEFKATAKISEVERYDKIINLLNDKNRDIFTQQFIKQAFGKKR